MRYLRKFKESSFEEMLPNIDGICCQFRDIGYDYKIDHYKDSLIILFVEFRSGEHKFASNIGSDEKDAILQQLDDYLVDYTHTDISITGLQHNQYLEIIFKRDDLVGSDRIDKEYQIYKQNKLFTASRNRE